MKRFLIILLLASAVFAQTLEKPKTFKVSADQAVKLKQIQDDYEKTVKHLQEIQTQWLIVAQRAALEAGMSAKDFDSMELAPAGDGFEFRVKQTAQVEKKP